MRCLCRYGLFGLLLAACLLASVLIRYWPSAPTSGTAPRTLFSHDFGPVLVQPGDPKPHPITHTFSVVNQSELVWHPRVTSSTCGCVTTRLGSRRVAPGETLTLTMTFFPSFDETVRTETVVVSTGEVKLLIDTKLSDQPTIKIPLWILK